MSKKILVVTVGGLLLLTGCGVGGDVSRGDIGVKTVTIDNEPVNCVVWDSNRAGGLDCDFN